MGREGCGTIKKVYDKDIVEDSIRKAKLSDKFRTEGLDFFVILYQRGEFLSTPDSQMPYFQFLVRGSVALYYLDENGDRRNVALMDGEGLLGDMEFALGNRPIFYIEAVTPVVVAALPMEKNRDRLEKDSDFLMYLLRNASRMKVFTARNSVVLPRLEELLLYHLKNECLHRTIIGMDDTAARLRCSRRQLQRVVKKLEEQGRLKKLRKGCYRLLGEN